MAKGIPGVPPALAAARVATQFKPGEGGRPKGVRDKLSRRFIEALAKDFDEHGEEVIQFVRERDPVSYMKVVAGLIPKEITGEGGEPLFSGVKVSFVRPPKVETTVN